MRLKRLPLYFVVLLLVVPVAARAQQWSGILDPSRAINWSNAGIPGGIPNRTTICATLNPGATSAQINSAIANCPPNQVVYLNPGTYSLPAGININGHSNVTLRGAGPTQTILQFIGGGSCGGSSGDICVINSTPYYDGSPAVQPGGSNAANWTAGYAQGTSQITLDNVSGLSVGSIIILDQANDQSDTRGLFVCDVPITCQAYGSGNSLGRTISGVDYSQQQFVRITAISGNVVTISPSLYMNNWRSTQTPKAWWTGSQITMVGIENLTVDNTGSGTGVASGIYFYDCYQCWVKNIKSIKGSHPRQLLLRDAERCSRKLWGRNLRDLGRFDRE
jgi:hypothetical protein